MRRVVLTVLVVAAASAWAFRLDVGGTWKFWAAIGGAYVVLGAVAVHKLWNDGTLLDRLKPKWGDISIGVVTSALLIFASWLARSWLTPAGTPRHLWYLRIYAQLGDPEAIQRSIVLTLTLFGIAALEELVWRGMVLDELEEKLGTRRAWPAAALLYGLALLPTMVTLSAPGAGPNPLLLIAGIGCGIVWSFTAMLTKRLPPVIISHVAFAYFTIVQFRWPGM